MTQIRIPREATLADDAAVEEWLADFEANGWTVEEHHSEPRARGVRVTAVLTRPGMVQ